MNRLRHSHDVEPVSKCSMHRESCSHECPPHRFGQPSENMAESLRVIVAGPPMLTDAWATCKKVGKVDGLTWHFDVLLGNVVGEAVQLVVHVEVAHAADESVGSEMPG